MVGAIMTHDAAVLKAREIASRVLAPSAGQNDKAGRFSTEAVVSLGESGLLGLMLPVDFGGLGLGPRTFAAVVATLAEADASVAMVYLMHILGTATISAGRPYHAHIAMVTACESAPRNHGLPARVTRTAMSFLRLPLKGRGPPIRPSISFRRRRAVFQWRGPGTGWDFGLTLLRRLRWTTAKSQPIFSLLMTAPGFRPC